MKGAEQCLEKARGAGIGDQAAAGAVPEDLPALTVDEKAVLEVLLACKTSRTPAQLTAACGTPRDEVIGALEGLRAKGLVIRFNTLVESYGARFPGIKV